MIIDFSPHQAYIFYHNSQTLSQFYIRTFVTVLPLFSSRLTHLLNFTFFLYKTLIGLA